MKYLCLLFLLTSIPCGAAASPSIPWQQLLRDARQYDIPMPSAKDQLVRWVGAHQYKGTERVPMWQMGFVQKNVGKDKVQVLLGATQRIMSRRLLKPLRGRRLFKGKLYAMSGYSFEHNAMLVTALQCYARGWRALAKELWVRANRHSAGHHFSIFYHPKGQKPRLALAYVARSLYALRITQSRHRFVSIHQKIQALISAFPQLRTTRSVHFLRSLALSSKMPLGKGSTPKAWVRSLHEQVNLKRRGFFPPKTPYEKLVVAGFSAVPALIHALEDEKLSRALTRSTKIGFNNFPTYHKRVADLVSDLLQGLAGRDLGRNWLRRQQGWTLQVKKVKAWWYRAKRKGEAAYLRQHVLPTTPKARQPRFVMLRIMSARYPKMLAGAYQRLLQDAPKLESHTMVDAIIASRLPRDAKVQLLSKGIQHRDMRHVRAALWGMKRAAPKLFIKRLKQRLQRIAKTPTLPYWRAPEVAIGTMVMSVDDEGLWKLFAVVARRVGVGMRMEWLNHCSYFLGKPKSASRTRRIDFLRSFLKDRSLRNVQKDKRRYKGPYAGRLYPRLRIRDMAAMQLGFLLKLKAYPKPSWSRARWKQHHKLIAQRLRQRDAKK